eukprot:scaffold32948_cov131-Isochrysis_galbana.AAC.2
MPASPWPTAANLPHASTRPAASRNMLCHSPAARGGASRQRRCRAHRARYVTHGSEQPMGRVLGTSWPPGKACSLSTVTTGDLFDSSAVSSPVPPWRKRVHVAETRSKSRISSSWHTALNRSSGRSRNLSWLLEDPAMTARDSGAK